MKPAHDYQSKRRNVDDMNRVQEALDGLAEHKDVESNAAQGEDAQVKTKMRNKNHIDIPKNLTKRDLLGIVESSMARAKQLERRFEAIDKQNRLLKTKLMERGAEVMELNQSILQNASSKKTRGARKSSRRSSPDQQEQKGYIRESSSDEEANICQKRNTMVLLRALNKARNAMGASREVLHSTPHPTSKSQRAYEWILDRLCKNVFGVVFCDNAQVVFIDPVRETLTEYTPHLDESDNAESVTNGDTSSYEQKTPRSCKFYEDSTISHVIRVGHSVISNTVIDGQTNAGVLVVSSGSKPGKARKGASILCAPIFTDHGSKYPFAVLRLTSYGKKFQTDDQAVVDSLLLSVGSAIANIRLSLKLHSSQFRNDALVKVVNTVSSEYETDRIIGKIIEVAYKVLNADRVSMFLADFEKKVLISTVSKDTKGFTVPFGKGIAGLVAQTGVDVNVEDVYNDPNFDRAFDKKTNYRTKSLLCAAVTDAEGRCRAVLQAINKKDRHGVFTKDDQVVMRFIADNAGITLSKSRLIDAAHQERRKNAALVEVVKAVNSSDGNADLLVQNLVAVAYNIVECERVTLFLVDDVRQELVCHVSKDASGFRIPLGKGIAGYVGQTGETVNIEDVYQDARFNQAMDKKTGFVTRNILCMAVRDKENEVVAVVQAINKINSPCFNAQDEYLLEAFCHEVAIALKRAALETAIQGVVDDKGEGMFLSQFMKRTSTNVKRPMAGLGKVEIRQKPGELSTNLKSWEFNVLSYDENSLLGFAVEMLQYYHLIDRFQIAASKLRNFLLEVRQGYRPNPFHNFYHGLGVMQASFTVLGTTEVETILSGVETLGLLVGSLCHDIDHPGTTNQYQVNAHTDLAIIYNDTAVLENHHAASTFQIVRHEGCDIFHAIPMDDFKHLRKCLVQGILATDMTHHFDMTDEVQSRSDREEPFLADSTEDRQLLINVIIHLADVSNPVLPNFNLVRNWAVRICQEFTNQRKMEEREGLPVSVNADLETLAEVAKLQLGFLDFIVGPPWKAIGEIFPELAQCYKNLRNNREMWRKISEEEVVMTMELDEVEQKESKV